MKTVQTSQLHNACQQLKLTTVLKQVDSLAELAQRQQQPYTDFLYELLNLEIEKRLERRTQRLIKAAKFPMIKTLEQFDFQRAPHICHSKINLLAQGEFIQNAEPIIFLGDPGTGKTHLAQAIGYQLILNGYAVRFITASQLINQLVEAHDKHQLTKLLAQLQRCHALIIDELGYLPMQQHEAELLFQIFSQRHELKPVIVTSNLPFSEWTSVFTDPRLCRALLDRLTHRAHIIQTGNESMRLNEALKQTNSPA